MIKESFKDVGIANYVQNNLIYTSEDDHTTVRWSVNLDAIINNFDKLTGYPSAAEIPTKYAGPAYFLNGSKSVQYADEIYLNEFPNARVAEIEGAGHYVHIDKGQTTLQLLAQCLTEIENYQG